MALESGGVHERTSDSPYRLDFDDRRKKIRWSIPDFSLNRQTLD
jgi:hypothetical protein